MGIRRSPRAAPEPEPGGEDEQTEPGAEAPSTGGGLNLPDVLGASVEDSEAIAKKWDTAEAARKYTRDAGFPEPERPSFGMPKLSPEELNTPDNRSYTEKYGRFHAWLCYATPFLAEIKVDLLQLANQKSRIALAIKEQVRAQNANLLKADRITEAQLKDKTELDPTYTRLSAQEQELIQKRLLVESYVDTINETMKIISRQIEIRKMELGGGQQTENMPGRGRQYPKSG